MVRTHTKQQLSLLCTCTISRNDNEITHQAIALDERPPEEKRLMSELGIEGRPRSITLLFLIEGLSSIFGFIGGVGLIADPSGALLGSPLGGTKALSSLPIAIHDFFLPGIWLLLAYGIGFAVVVLLLWSHSRQAWPLAFILCIVWLGWITFEVVFFGPDPLTTVWYIPQVAGLILLVNPKVRSYVSKFS